MLQKRRMMGIVCLAKSRSRDAHGEKPLAGISLAGSRTLVSPLRAITRALSLQGDYATGGTMGEMGHRTRDAFGVPHARLLHVGNGSGNGRDRQQGHDRDHLQRIHGSPLPPIPPHTLNQDRQYDPEDHDHGHGHGPEEGNRCGRLGKGKGQRIPPILQVSLLSPRSARVRRRRALSGAGG